MGKEKKGTGEGEGENTKVEDLITKEGGKKFRKRRKEALKKRD